MARVLVVDDDKGFRELAADVLELAGHDVETADCGEVALQLVRRKSFHVMLLDLRLGRLDGMTLLKIVQEEQPELEVLVMTAHGTVASAVEAMRLGAFHYLQKPLESNDQLRLDVARAAERRALRDAHEDVRIGKTVVRLTWGAPAMEVAVATAARVAVTDATVLLVGESGVGKEVVARAIHAWSKRANKPFVAANCAAFSDPLLESELFGHEKGAFTGAVCQRRGRLELADGGTFLMDEVGELRFELQARFLRVLQEQSFERVGGSRTITTDVRLITATNRDLETMVSAGAFREDLYHRLAVFPIRIPPLRERREDILPLAKVLLDGIASDLGRPGLRMTEEVCQIIVEQPWPGNVRELANTLERAAILSDGRTVTARVFESQERISPGIRVTSPSITHAAHEPSASPIQGGRTQDASERLHDERHAVVAPPSIPAPEAPEGEAQPIRTLKEIEREMIERAIERLGSRRRAAAALGIGLRTLYEKLNRYKLG